MTRKIASLEKWLASKDDIASNFLEYWNGRSIDLGEIDPSMKNKYDVDISFFVLHRNLYDRLVRADRYLKSRKVKSQNFNHNKFNYLIHDLSETICRPDIAVKLASAVRSACEDNTQFICCFCRYLEIYNLRKSGQYNLALSVSDNVDSKLEAEYIYSDPSFQYLVMVSTVRSACFLDRYEESRNNNDFRSAESSLNLAEELGGTSDYTKNVRIRLTSLKRRKSRNSE